MRRVVADLTYISDPARDLPTEIKAGLEWEPEKV